MRRDDPRRTASSPRNIKDCTAQMRGGAASKKRLTAKAPYKSGPFAPPALPGLNALTTLSDTRLTIAYRDVEAATLDPNGSPPITRITFPTCRAHYPGGSSRCMCRLLPRPRSLPQQWPTGRHPHCHFRGLLRLHSRYSPLDRSATKATFVTRLRPCQLPGQTARQLPDQSTTVWMDSSSIGDTRLRGALLPAS